MANDVFRPRLPIDPFAGIDHFTPWHISLHDPTEPQAHVVLVLGTPSHADLAPLATSSLLSHSLLIIATHTPPPIPTASSGPNIIILHLPSPLDVHDSGALRLASLLERAQKVAHSWRTSSPAPRRIQQFAELYPGGEFSISEEPELSTAAAVPPPRTRRLSPLAGELDRDTDTASTLSASTSSSTTTSSNRRSLKPSSPKHKSRKKLQGQFSALINFLPYSVPDKALLKHAILVTTLSGPFLSPDTRLPSSFSPYQRTASNRRSIFSLSLSSLSSSAHHPHGIPRSRLSSLFSSSGPPSSYSTPPSVFASSRSPSVESLALSSSTKAAKHAHIIHVLPYTARSSHTPNRTRLLTVPHPHRTTRSYTDPTPRQDTEKSKLVQGIEQFLLSFAYPPSTSMASPSANARRVSGVPVPVLPLHLSDAAVGGSVIPFVVPAGVLGSRPSSSTSPSSSRPTTSSSSSRQNASSSSSRPTSSTSASTSTSTADNNHHHHYHHAFPRESVTMAVAELILLGGLDAVASGIDADPGGGGGGVEGWPRAWIGDVGDVVGSGGMGSGEGQGQGHVKAASEPTVRDMDLLQVPGGGGGKKTKESKTKESKGKAKGKGKEAEVGKKNKGKGKIRRNEAGLPTPPESSSSLEGGSTSSGSVSSEGGSGEGDGDGSEESGFGKGRKGREKRRGRRGERERERDLPDLPLQYREEHPPPPPHQERRHQQYTHEGQRQRETEMEMEMELDGEGETDLDVEMGGPGVETSSLSRARRPAAHGKEKGKGEGKGKGKGKLRTRVSSFFHRSGEAKHGDGDGDGDGEREEKRGEEMSERGGGALMRLKRVLGGHGSTA